MKRLFDIVASLGGLILLSPLLICLSIVLFFSTGGQVFFTQTRIGKNGNRFQLYKFRSMRIRAEAGGQLTIGGRDPRITPVGYFLRKYKLDELPQLWNILKGEMSVVGPRPEVPQYVALYTPEQRKVLSVRPGLTDYASLEYIAENEILGKAPDPEKTYTEEIMPAKLVLNLQYINDMGFRTDCRILGRTLLKIFRLQ